MKNFNKKNLVLFGLIGLLVVLSYANYMLFYNNQSKEVALSQDDPVNAELVKNVDENEVMAGNVVVSEEFFTQCRLERETVRSENLDTLQKIVDDKNSSLDTVKSTQKQILELTKLSEKEMVTENLIKAKGFKDVVVLIHEGYANVIVDADKLTTAQATQIQDVVNKETNIPISKIAVSTGKKAE